MRTDNSGWKDRINLFLGTCQDELRRTAIIGKKMLNASKTNSDLRESYEKLGEITAQAVRAGKLKWSDEKVHELVDDIERHKADLLNIEEEVEQVKGTTNDATKKR